ncbi:PilC/PilY family type IV pilus protein [Congregibacter variabilis]|uniref:PilC/PilY family type IV pilus protein n=1 Tax=Congregibacter variabilis TaxID=3081200 RepID=A0ABZ0I4L6_9GAMM|nr:PilC/PilY family type IV pilus protein [Congregibacter sp. IMCC43200]
MLNLSFKPQSLNKLASFAFGCFATFPVWAADVDIATKPLFVTAGVEPNIIVAIDDSGSMDWEFLHPTSSGVLWWNANDASYVGRDANGALSLGVLNYNSTGGFSAPWYPGGYLFPNGTATGNRVYPDGDLNIHAVPPFPQYAFARSAAFNGMYYDSALDYKPWPSVGANTFTDVLHAAAPSDPTRGSGTFNLTLDHRDLGSNQVFRLFKNMVIPSGTTYFDGVEWVQLTADMPWPESTSNGIEYYPATYYEPNRQATIYSLLDSATGNTVQGRCDSPVAAHYKVFERSPGSLSGVDALSYDGSCLVKIEIKPGVDFASKRSYAEEMQNFANWWSYYRKRHLATRGGLAESFESQTGARMGVLTINSRSLNGMYSLSDSIERNSIFNFFYDVGGNRAGTPNREALKYVGDQFHTNSNVITQSCQQNFALLFTDGFANPTTTSGVGNADGDMGVPFQDNYSNTIADIAAKYYKQTLRGTAFASGNVPVPTQCQAASPPLALDCNSDLHMSTYGVTLGAQGNIFGGEAHSSVADAHTTPPAWMNPTQVNPVQVDDLYHAAVNGHGEMLNAQSAEELREVLSDALLDIVDRSRSSGTSSSTSAAILQADTLLYSVEFRSDDWSGDLIAQEVSVVDGSIVRQAWSAEARLAARSTSGRTLLTWDGSSGADLQFDNLAQAQKDALNVDLSNTVDGAGSQRIAWLRGDAVSGFRSRTTFGSPRRIGDIVNSSPLYVGSQNRGYSLLPAEFSPGTYGAFRGTIEDRSPMMVVGSNDGFMHVFDGDTGDELFAFMPSELLLPEAGDSFARASLLTNPNYEHRYFVDGTPAVNDVLINGSWKTILIGSMGVGGRTVFAIDVTDPETIDASDVLWEFTDSDLGYGVTDVQIVPTANGGFSAIFGNGYNSDSDSAVLFVLDVSDGSLLAKIDTGTGDSSDPNGLGPVVSSSWPQLNFTTQYAYAGDLHGNLWRFDLTSARETQWTDADEVFVATDVNGDRQPITVQPRISLNPERSGELIINFGTGSFFRDQDNLLTNPQIQTLYGIRETLSNTTITRPDLLQQEILFQDTVTALGDQRIVRQISDNDYAASTNGNGGSEESGWFLDLVYGGNNVGERVISKVTFPSGSRRERVRFTSMTPSNDPCSSGRTGFIFDLDLFTGGATDFSVFDINDDGFFNVDDLVDLKMVNAISGGRGEDLTVIRNQQGSGDFFYDGTGGRIGNTTGAEGLATGDPLGRQSWQQLR